MTYMNNRDFEGLEIAKNMEFNKLFEYSSFWDMQYNGLKVSSKFPEKPDKYIAFPNFKTYSKIQKVKNNHCLGSCINT